MTNHDTAHRKGSGTQGACSTNVLKKILLPAVILLLCGALLCGAAAADAAVVTTEQQLKDAVSSDSFDVVLGDDIELLSTLSVTKTGTLDLNGHTLEMTGIGSVIKVLRGGDLTINDSSDGLGTVTGGWSVNGGGVCVDGGRCTFNNGNISENFAYYGGGVYVGGSGTFTMNGGSISYNRAVYGGGVFVGDFFRLILRDTGLLGHPFPGVKAVLSSKTGEWVLLPPKTRLSGGAYTLTAEIASAKDGQVVFVSAKKMQDAEPEGPAAAFFGFGRV